MQHRTKPWIFCIQITIDSEFEHNELGGILKLERIPKLLPHIMPVLTQFFRFEDISRSWDWKIYGHEPSADR